MHLGPIGFLGKIYLTVRCLKVEELVLSVSDRVVFSTSSSSLRPCAMHAVEAMVSKRDDWSNHETLSVTSLSPRSIRDALEALWDLAGLTLNMPLDDVTAWWNSWYCATETFLWDPSSSSSSETDLSLTFPFQRCGKIDQWSIPGSRFWRGGSSNQRPWMSGISGLVYPSGTSDWSPGSSVWSPGTPDWSPGSSRWSLIISGHRCLINGSGMGDWSWQTQVHPSLH